MPEIPGHRERLPRRLGTWGIWLLVVNGLIGAGIFGLPGEASRLAGSWSPLIYVACALLILPILLCFAELASYYRSSGGPIRYATDAFGNFAGFQAGWLFWAARTISFSANSVLLVDSIGWFLPGAAEGDSRLMTLFLVCAGLAAINVIGSLRAIRSLAVLTVVKIAVLLLLVLVGIALLGSEVLPRFEPASGSGEDIGAAVLLLIYAYVGFESAVVPAGEARNPARDMPRALLLGLGVVALIYLLVQLVSVAAVPDIAGSKQPLLDVADALMGPTAAVLLMVGIVASVGGNLVSAMFSTPRITYALANDGNLPGWFGQVHSRFQTPANSILFYAAVSFLLAAFGSFAWLAASTVLSRLLVYGVSCAALPRLRPGRLSEEAFRLPGGWLLPGLALLSCGWLLLQVSLQSMLLTAGFLVFGSLLFLLARGRVVVTPRRD